ncbi:tein kinase 4-like protein [Colletotrichum kahawae]|uniref:non-specific serine/threonine protein kinase n=1 Tax=Colletotrichum kahawae TaxID=34407 RepID=A0AAD9YK55_COLKA|nr:tein kinase 4-like protein [Colletotrichum kahawae]
MSENHIVTKLREHVAEFIERYGCYGINGYGDRREFVPQLALTEFWTLEKITAVFCHDRNKLILHSAVDIMNHYIVIFSILVLTSGAEHLELFTQEDIKDISLPLLSIPESYRESSHKEAFEGFLKAQWKFFPLPFSVGLNPKPSKKNLSPEMILPISPTAKAKINPEADEKKDMAVLYKVDFHPKSTLLAASVVFKEYLKPGPESQKLYDNEWAMYTQLKEESFNHIVRYHGSFQCLDRRTIVLEYAPGGDLLSFFKKRRIPRTDCQRAQFWQNIFGLFEGLVAIDDLTQYGGHSRDTWHLKGTHQDIRPQNILICGDPSDEDYSVPFKFADMGLAHIRQVKNGGIDRFAVDHFGNGMYSAPEAFRDDGSTKTIRHKSDVYSLGGILSEAFIWAIWGERGRDAYQAERVEATREVRLKGGFHEGAFHDGDGLLHVVERWHDRAVALTNGKAGALSQLILKCTLAADPDLRKTAAQVFQEFKAIIPTLESDSLPRNYVSSKQLQGWPASPLSLATRSQTTTAGSRDSDQSPTPISRNSRVSSMQPNKSAFAPSFTASPDSIEPSIDPLDGLAHDKETQPVSLYVLTNGHWDTTNSSITCGVEKPIERLVKHIVEKNKQANWAMVQFIGFYRDPPSKADRHGKALLKRLDNNLGLERDIVDTRNAKKDVRKILLGPFSTEADESPSDSDSVSDSDSK